jgi:hypothetical protein
MYAGESKFDSRWRQRYSLYCLLQIGSGAHNAPYEMGRCGFSPGLNRPECEPDHSYLPSADDCERMKQAISLLPGLMFYKTAWPDNFYFEKYIHLSLFAGLYFAVSQIREVAPRTEMHNSHPSTDRSSEIVRQLAQDFEPQCMMLR